MTDKKPVDDPAFWRYRLLWALSHGRGTHTAVYDVDKEEWDAIQNSSKNILSLYAFDGIKLLDAGCGVGTLCSYLPKGVKYVGIDISPEMVEVARLSYPLEDFRVADMRCLPFDTCRFDLAICRSIRSMVLDNLGQAAWDTMQAELLRVSDKLIVVEYEDMANYEVLTL